MKRFFVCLLVVAMPLGSMDGAASTSARNDDPVIQSDMYAERAEKELRGNILPYWLQHARDIKRGGFYGEIVDGDEPHEQSDRGALLTARILWTYSAAYRRYHDTAYLEMAKWAYDDLIGRFWDKTNGGLYWSTSADGIPKDARKIVYVQSFGIYGLAEYALASGEKAPLDRAIELYRLLEEKAHDRVNRGYFEEFSRDWKKSRGRGAGSAMGSLGQKSQNVHLHLLEAYTGLMRAWPDAGLKVNLADLIEVMMTKILDVKNHHLRLFLEEDWKPQGETFSYGHDVEFSWLIVEAAEVLGDETVLEKIRPEAVKIAAVSLREGVDPDGGMMGEGNAKGVSNTFKEWWPQAEAAVGFINAYQISHDPAFLTAAYKTWDFIDQCLIDHKNGEWFIGVSREGKVEAPIKVSFWKCPYHNGRSCLEVSARLRAIRRP